MEEPPLSYFELGWLYFFDTKMWEYEMLKSRIRREYADLRMEKPPPLSYFELGWLYFFDTIMWEHEKLKSQIRKEYADLKRQYDSTLEGPEKNELQRSMDALTYKMEQLIYFMSPCQ